VAVRPILLESPPITSGPSREIETDCEFSSEVALASGVCVAGGGGLDVLAIGVEIVKTYGDWPLHSRLTSRGSTRHALAAARGASGSGIGIACVGRWMSARTSRVRIVSARQTPRSHARQSMICSAVVIASGLVSEPTWGQAGRRSHRITTAARATVAVAAWPGLEGMLERRLTAAGR
jgi:hypothetical protein